MNKISTILITAIVGLGFMGCVQFKPLALYDSQEKVIEAKNINGVYCLTIFKDLNSSEVWGMEKTPFKDCKFTSEVTYKGNGALELQWDKLADNSQWIGVGFGWDGWSGKDLEPIEDKAALQFYIRTAKDTLKNLVWVMQLEDYGNKQSIAVFKDNNYLENKVLTTEWNKVTIPLKEFSMNRADTDWSNIKHLVIQFEVKGHVFIDEIELVPYTPPIANASEKK